MMGFISASNQRRPLPILPRCGECLLYTKAKNPKIPVAGKGRRRVLIVSEFPLAEDDKKGKLHAGDAGSFLRKCLSKIKVDLDKDCWYTSALICAPTNIGEASKKIPCCTPNLLKTIKELNPVSIVLMGDFATRSLIPVLWKDSNIGGIEKWYGWEIPAQITNTWVHPTWSVREVFSRSHKVQEMMFVSHLRSAFEHKHQPFDKIPDYEKEVKCVFDIDEAVETILRLSKGSRAVAFDYETNMLKPDSARSEIRCASISDGNTTIAFPWTKEIKEAFAVFVRSDVRKIASNMKFEERWTRRIVGKSVNNWWIDTMLASHVLDNRKGIASIKFQSFVRLGQPDYDSHVKPFLKSKEPGCYSENRVRDCDWSSLLLYCGLDSLLEYKVAIKQAQQFQQIKEEHK